MSATIRSCQSGQVGTMQGLDVSRELNVGKVFPVRGY